MNLKVGEKYWTVESREGSSAGISEPWLAKWMKRDGNCCEAHFFWSEEHLSGNFYPSSGRFTVKIYSTELEAQKAYVCAKLEEAHGLMVRSKAITAEVLKYARDHNLKGAWKDGLASMEKKA